MAEKPLSNALQYHEWKNTNKLIHKYRRLPMDSLLPMHSQKYWGGAVRGTVDQGSA